MDMHTDISDTEYTPETFSQGTAPLSLFQTMTPTNTSGDFTVYAENDF
jgi:hypothetical protein